MTEDTPHEGSVAPASEQADPTLRQDQTNPKGNGETEPKGKPTEVTNAGLWGNPEKTRPAETKGIEFSEPGPGGGRRKRSYRRAETTSVSRLDRKWADINALIEEVALDALDRDIRVIFLISRINDIEPARRLANALGDPRPMVSSADEAGFESFRVDDIIEAVGTALTEADAADTVFIDTLSVTALDGTFPAAALRWAGDGADADEEGPSSRLRTRNARLIALVVAERGQSLMPLLETQLQTILLPWTGTWLTKAANSRGFGEAEFDRDVVRELRTAACVFDSASNEREKVLHRLLEDERRMEDADGPTALAELIRGAIEKSRKGERKQAEEAHAQLLKVMCSDDDPIYGGPIGRTILLVALLVPNRPATAVLELCRYLLPEGPALVTCLTAVLRQTWESGVKDDRRLHQPTRPPPRWEAVFDAVSDRVVNEIGLYLGPKGYLQRDQKLSALDLEKSLLAQNGHLMELARRILRQASAPTLPMPLIPVLVDLATALHRLDGAYLSLHDLVSIFTGVQDYDADLGVDTARTLQYALELWTESRQADAAHLDDFLRLLFDRIPTKSALTVLAYLVLYGPCPPPQALGRLTLKLFSERNRADFTEGLRSFRQISGDVMRAALRPEDRPVGRVDQWADALWIAADDSEFRSYGKALAIWLDDLLSTWEIPATAQDLHRPPRDPALLSRLMIRSADGRAGAEYDLLGRLFRRTPRERLEALQRLEFFAGGPRDETAPALRLKDMVARRLEDVFWIMIQEINPEEAEHRCLRSDQLESVVWSTLSRHYKLAMVLDSASATQAICDQINAPTATRSDSRALLDLYAPATLMFWRFDRFDTRTLVPDGDGYDDFLATLDRVAKAIAPPEHQQRARLAWTALTDVQERLVAYFRSQRCLLTKTRHEERLACWLAVKRYLFPDVPSAVQLTGEKR